MIRNREWKMVVLLTTALALGVGTVAACVIPWLYCKPPSSDDDDHQTSGIRGDVEPGAHSRPAEKNRNPNTNIRINGVSYVKIVTPLNSSIDNPPAVSTSATQTSTTQDGSGQENLTIEGSGQLLPARNINDVVEQRRSTNEVSGQLIQVLDDDGVDQQSRPTNEATVRQGQTHNVNEIVQLSGTSNPMTSGATNFESSRTDSRNTESTVASDNSVSVSKDKEIQATGSELENSGASQSESINTETLRVRLFIKTEETAFAILPSSKRRNSHNESFTESTYKTLPSTSRHPDTIETYDATAESKDMSTSATHHPSLVSNLSADVDETCSRTLTSSDPSNPTDQSTTETIARTSTSQQSENSSSGPTRVLTYATVEPAKIPDALETIREVSTSPAPAPKPSLVIPRQLDDSSSKINRTPHLWIGDEGSMISTSTRASRRMDLHFAPPDRTSSVNSTPDSTQTALSKCPEGEIRKTSRSSRWTLSDPFKNILRRIKIPTRRSARGRGDQESYVESVKSLSGGKKLPTGHSTMISEEQRLLDVIRTRRSPVALTPCNLKLFDDPGIANNDNLSYGHQSIVQVDEEPLDLSTHSTPERNKETTGDTRQRSPNRSAESCGEAFREVAEYLKVRRISKFSEEGARRSDTLMFCGDVSKMTPKDENQNVRLDSSNPGSVNVEETKSFVNDFEASRLESGCSSKSDGLQRRIKKMLHIGSKDRSNRNKILSSVGKGQVLNSMPTEFQRCSAGTSSQPKSELNINVLSKPDSPADVVSYYELGLAMSDGKKPLDPPCTDL